MTGDPESCRHGQHWREAGRRRGYRVCRCRGRRRSAHRAVRRWSSGRDRLSPRFSAHSVTPGLRAPDRDEGVDRSRGLEVERQTHAPGRRLRRRAGGAVVAADRHGHDRRLPARRARAGSRPVDRCAAAPRFAEVRRSRAVHQGARPPEGGANGRARRPRRPARSGPHPPGSQSSGWWRPRRPGRRRQHCAGARAAGHRRGASGTAPARSPTMA